MINKNILKAEIIKNGYTQEEVAKKIGITPKTFYLKMKKGVFGSDEIQVMIDILNIDNPIEIFLLKKQLNKLHFNNIYAKQKNS